MHKDIDEFLTQDRGGKFNDGTWFLLLFGSFSYTPTGEKGVVGYRYDVCGMDAPKQAFDSADLSALLTLPFALDEEGGADSSSVAVNLRYTGSGSAVALQLEEHQDSEPGPVSEVRLYEGTDAKALLPLITNLDQSR